MTEHQKTPRPEFAPGRNIALKTPAHEFDRTVAFYRDTLGFKVLDLENIDPFESVAFAFGDKVLWVDRIAGLSQSEVWLEIVADDTGAAKAYLAKLGCAIRDEIEPLPTGLDGFWLSSPSNTIHLVVGE